MKTILHYRSCGSIANPAIVFLHGFMGKSNDFHVFMKHLASQYFCVAFDLPGHGKSLLSEKDFSELHNVLSVAKLVHRHIKVMGLSDYTLYGYSMGGRIAQEIALLKNNTVKRLILESSSPGILSLEEKEIRYQKDIILLKDIHSRDDLISFLYKWYNLPLFKTLKDSKKLSLLIDSKLKNDVSQLQRSMFFLSVGCQRYCLNDIAELLIPVYYFHGKKDEKYSFIAKQLQEKNIKIVSFEDASHNVHYEFPDRFMKHFILALEET